MNSVPDRNKNAESNLGKYIMQSIYEKKQMLFNWLISIRMLLQKIDMGRHIFLVQLVRIISCIFIIV